MLAWLLPVAPEILLGGPGIVGRALTVPAPPSPEEPAGSEGLLSPSRAFTAQFWLANSLLSSVHEAIKRKRSRGG